MGIYYMTTVGVGFEVPLENIHAAAEGTGEYYAEEALERLLWDRGYKTLSVASAHAYDATDSETDFVIAIDRLTKAYDENGTFGVVVFDSAPLELTREEQVEVGRIQAELGIYPTPVVQFVASSMI